ncbi:MAG: ATP-binding cassette domain-containing protein [Candidatus Puniceispirillaceae bacterium]
MLEVKNVAFAYAGTPPAEFVFNLTVARGEIVVVSGRSGVGKSTLLNLIAGFLTPDHGCIMWQGQDLAGTAPADRPLSMIFQDDNLFDHLTCRLNVALGLRPSLSLSKAEWQAVDAAMDELGILAVQQRLPRAISGGQQQRVALARALIRAAWQNRQLLLFDEPFSALDPDTRADCIDRVKHLVASNNMAALVVSHNPDDAVGLNAAEITLPLSSA